MKSRIGLVGLLAFGLVAGGCSFVFVKPVSVSGSGCSHSQALPTVDGILAAGQVVGLIYYATTPDSTFQDKPISRGGALALNGLAAGVFVASAIYGSSVVTDCREAYPHDVEPVVVRRSRRRQPQPDWTPPPPPPLWTPPPATPARAIAAPTSVDGARTDDATPNAGAADAVPHAAPPPLAPPIRQRADDE